MATQQEQKNLPATMKAQNIRQLLTKSRSQLELALPKHLTVDRLLRVAMTSIQRNPKLLDCTPQSLLACIMTCAQLGLEPDQFLGQAYLVPFWNEKKKAFEAQLIPGYRGLIALMRRSGELAGAPMTQVVYEKDEFDLEFGLEKKLFHRPFLGGPRGEARGAYTVFYYKDGTNSFDFMPIGDIDAIARRSKTYDAKKNEWSGPWATDVDEMRKKTVIKRHSKVAPVSIEMGVAIALEDRFHAGESQIDLLTGEVEAINGESKEEEGSVELFMDLAKEKTKGNSKLQAALFRYVVACADHYKTGEDQVKKDASLQFDKFWATFEQWVAKQTSQGKGQVQQGVPFHDAFKDTGTGNGKDQGDRPSEGQSGGQEEAEERRVACPKENGEETRTLKWCSTSCEQMSKCQSFVDATWEMGRE